VSGSKYLNVLKSSQETPRWGKKQSRRFFSKYSTCRPTFFRPLSHNSASIIAWTQNYIWLVFNSYSLLDLYRPWGLFGLCLRSVNNAQFQFIGTRAACSKAGPVGPHAAELIIFVLNRFYREVAARNVDWFTGYEYRHASVLPSLFFRINAVRAP